MDQEELRAWLRLVLTPHVGLISARRLLAALGSPQAVFAASRDTLLSLVPAREANALLAEPEVIAGRVAATQAWLADPQAEAPRHVVTLGDPLYPPALLEVADPPLLLFVQGRAELLQRGRAVAIVGSRTPTPQGRDNAFEFAKALSLAGVTVVSGLAEGIDGAAHEGALSADSGGSGGTMAVVGTGLDRVYPAKHRALAHRIAKDGVLISEFMLGTPPLAANFPKRNRIVAALTRGTLVVEAAVQSGSLITARLAAEMGRDVLAIPGSIHSPQARGCHALIKQGAKLVETAQDVLEELRWPAQAFAGAAAEASTSEALALAAQDEGDPVLGAMGYDPVSQDALAARTGLGPAELGARLLELELVGQVARLPGALYQRVAAA